MKKLILSTIATLSLVLAQNPIVSPDDTFSQIDRLFQMQLKQMEEIQKKVESMFKEFDEKYIKKSMPVIMSSGGMISSGVQDKGDHYEVVVNVGPGNVKADVTAKDNLLTINIEKKIEKETNSTFGVVKSFSTSTFMQTFTLPSDANSKDIDYTIKDGKMIVKIPKVKS